MDIIYPGDIFYRYADESVHHGYFLLVKKDIWYLPTSNYKCDVYSPEISPKGAIHILLLYDRIGIRYLSDSTVEIVPVPPEY